MSDRGWSRGVRRAYVAFAESEVSSRSLGLVRILASGLLLYRLTDAWALYKLDDWPGAAVAALVIMVAAIFTLVGFKTRIFAVVLIVAFAIAHLHYGATEHVLKLSKPVFSFQLALLLAISPCDRSFSIDRYLAVRRARALGIDAPPETIRYWYLDLFALQMASMYFWAAMDKVDAGWLSGGRMARMYMHLYGSSDSLVYTPLVEPVAAVMAWSVTVCELALAAFLIPRASRPYVLWAGIALHLGILFTISVNHFTFPVFVVYLLFFRPDRVHDVIDVMLGGSTRRGST